jgi:hypothetical protein
MTVFRSNVEMSPTRKVTNHREGMEVTTHVSEKYHEKSCRNTFLVKMSSATESNILRWEISVNSVKHHEDT